MSPLHVPVRRGALQETRTDQPDSKRRADEQRRLPPRQPLRIFDKFTRLGDHLTRPQQGIGLGLYIARQSVEQLGGDIWCEERPGGGARFAFRLPLGDPGDIGAVPEPALPAKAPKPRSAAGTPRRKVPVSSR